MQKSQQNQFNNIKIAISINSHESVIKKLTTNTIPINFKDEFGNTLLHYSCMIPNINLAIVQELISRIPQKEKEKFINLKNNAGETPLYYAHQYLNITLTYYLIDHLANKTIKFKSDLDLLDLAIEKFSSKATDNTKIINYVIALFNEAELIDKLFIYKSKKTDEKKIKILKSIIFLSRMNIACERQDLQAVTNLLIVGNETFTKEELTDILNLSTSKHGTELIKFSPLHIACISINNNPEIVKLLLDHGADSHSKTMIFFEERMSAYELALESCFEGTSSVLKAITNHKFFNKQLAMEYEAKGNVEYEAKGNEESEDRLKNADKLSLLKIKDIFHKAINEDKEDLISHWIKNNIIIIKNISFYNKTALHTAAQSNKPKILEILLNAISVQIEDNDLREAYINETFKGISPTALHFACINNDAESFKLLIKAGANTNIKDSNGKYPIQLINPSDIHKFIDPQEKLLSEESKKLLPSTSYQNASPSISVKIAKTLNKTKEKFRNNHF